MNKINLMGYIMCLVAGVVGISVVVPELVYYVPAETALFTVSCASSAYGLTSILKCVR